MPSKETKLKLLDLVDIKFLQELQDTFAKVSDVASITVDDDGPITESSNFTGFCIKYAKGSSLGFQKCIDYDIQQGKIAAEKGEPIIYTCRSGLTCFAVPIFIENQHIATILGGQVFTEKPDIKHFKNIAKELEIDENEYINVLKKVKIISLKHIEAIIHLLSLIANTISEMANKNLQLTKKTTEKDTFYKQVVDTIRSSLNIDETKQKIVTIIGKTFGADRCLIAEYDKTTDKVFKIEDEYLSSKKINSYKGMDITEIAPDFVEIIKKGENIKIKDKNICIKEDDKQFTKEKKIIKKNKVNSAYIFPLYHSGELIGGLSISYLNKKHEITKEEINLLNIITNQIAIAIYQSNLYKLTQVQAEREQILRKVIEVIRSSIDLDETLKIICDEVAKIFKVQRATIIEFFNKQNFNDWITRREYKERKEIKGLKDVPYAKGVGAYNGQIIMQEGKNLIIDDIEKSDTPDYYKKTYQSMGVKSILSVPIQSGDNKFGIIFLSSYDEYRHWSKEEVQLLESIASQIYVAIKQAEMFEKQKETAKAEKILRKIIETVRSSLDLTEVKKRILKELCIAFNADRCFFRNYDKINDTAMPVDIEYLASPNVKSILNVESNQAGFRYFIEEGKKQKKGFYPIVVDEKFIKDPNIEEYFKYFDIKADYAIPLIDRQDELVWIVLHYTKEDPKLSEDYKQLLETVAYQIDIAFEQIKLYNETKMVAEREQILRKIIEAVRSSLDINIVKKNITQAVGKAFKADRCYFRTYDKLKDESSLADAEYISSPDIKKISNTEIKQISFRYFIDEIKKRKKGFYPIIADEETDKDIYLEAFMNEFDIKADYVIPIINRKEEILWLMLHYTKEDPKFSEDYKQLLETIAYQIDIAFEQIKLYNETKEIAEREQILRKIIEASRKSLDFNTVLTDICQEIINIFNFGRASIGKIYNTTNKKGFVVIEVGAHENTKTSKEFEDFYPIEIYWRESLRKKLSIKIIEDIENSDLPEHIKEMYQFLGVKSLLALPLGTKDMKWGGIVLSDYEKCRQWKSEEINLFETIAAQIFVAIRQSELYEKEKETAQREQILRKVIESSRKSLIFQDVLNDTCNAIIDLFKVDRVSIGKSSEDNSKDASVFIEQRANNDIISSSIFNNYNIVTNYWDRILKIENYKAITDILDSDLPEEVKNIYHKMDIKSIIAISMGPQGTPWGGLFLTQNKYHREWKPKEIELLETIASQSYIAIRQSELYEKEKETAQREQILRKVIEASRKSLLFQDVLNDTCNALIDLFKVDKVSIGKSPIDKSKEATVFIEQRASENIPPTNIYYKFNIVTNYWNNNMKIGEYKAISNIIESDLPDNVKNIFNEMGIKSIIAVPLGTEDYPWGGLFLSQYSHYRTWKTEEIELLETIASQSYIAIRQSELYEKEKETAQRETLLREITSQISSTLDYNQIRKTLVSSLGNTLGSDFNILYVYDLRTQNFVPIDEYSLHLTSEETKNPVGINILKEYEWSDFIMSQKSTIYYSDVEEFKKEYNLYGTKQVEFLDEYKIKSAIFMPIKHAGVLLGLLALNFTKGSKTITQEDLNLANAVASQAGIALYQANLYKLTQEQAEKESLLRKISETIRSSLDINVIKSTIVSEICKVMDMDLCFMLIYDPEQKTFFVDEHSEYRSFPDVQSFVNFDAENPAVKWFIDSFKQNKEVHFSDTDEYIAKNNLKGSPEEAFLKSEEYNLKSSYSFRINYADKMLGHILIEAIKEHKKFEKEDLDFIRIIADQAGIALYQAELFKKEKETAQREVLLRQIMEAIRSSLDINVIKNKIVTEIGKAFDSATCFIILYDSESDTLYIDEHSEYRAPDEEKSLIGFNSNAPNIKWFVNQFKNHKEVNYECAEKFIEENNLQDTPEMDFLREYNIKSSYSVPIFYADNFLGYIVLRYTKNYQKLSDETLNFIRTIATQAGIALHQAKLYQITQIQAEREKIGKNIIEILRSSLDKNIIKHLFVKNIGKLFKADRVFFADYDQENNMYLPVDEDSEYLSGPDIQSFIGYDWSCGQASEYIQPLLEKRELNVFCWEDYIKQNPKGQDFIELFESSNTKSSYNLPVLYQGEIMGFFCIEFTRDYCQKLTDEDINRIRNMCTQAGIALYHADLYIKAQEATRFQRDFIAKTTNDCIGALNTLVDISNNLADPEINKEKQNEYINEINEISKEILNKVKSCRQNLDSQ